MIQDREAVTVVVGDEALAHSLRHAPESPVESIVTVEHYLAALGEMGRSKVGAVVGRVGPLVGSMEPTVRALRELAPAAKLLLIADASEEPAAMKAVRLGFDDYFIQPLDHDALVKALARPVTKTTAAAEAIHEAVRPIEAPAADSPAVRPLGDVDLVEQMLRDRKGLLPLAMKVIEQRAGEGAVQHVSEADPTAAACVPVMFNGHDLGYLASNAMAMPTLKAYANWLARWLSLERHIERLSDMALHDDLTGVWNRRYFDRFLASIVERAKVERFRVTLMVYDIDNFKMYNDRYGHQAGDEILQETAKLMMSVVRKHDVVARVGGDEFGVIFWDADPPRRKRSEHPDTVRTAAERFQRAVCEHRFPKLAQSVHGTLTISGGLASYPWDGQTPEELYQLADEMLLESKKQGKNALTFGEGAMRACGLIESDDDTQENAADSPSE
ncbi:MAG: diguanylate cyclase [Planctomycetes bacterium]|nr:diguanylate cyclase [Planctomycetota bacterium]